jgi:hypothetical protein
VWRVSYIPSYILLFIFIIALRDSSSRFSLFCIDILRLSIVLSGVVIQLLLQIISKSLLEYYFSKKYCTRVQRIFAVHARTFSFLIYFASQPPKKSRPGQEARSNPLRILRPSLVRLLLFGPPHWTLQLGLNLATLKPPTYTTTGLRRNWSFERPSQSRLSHSSY